MNKRSKLATGLIATACLVAGFALARIGSATSGDAKAAVDGQTVAVTRRDIAEVVRAVGTVHPHRQVDVGAQVTAQVRQIHVRLGQRVKKADLLVSLDPDLAQSDVQQAQAIAARARAQLDSFRIDLAQWRREHERIRLQVAADAASVAEEEAARTQVDKTSAAIAGEEATLAQLNAELDKKRLQLSFTKIAAPVDGEVVSIAVQEGQTVNATQLSPVLLTLASLDRVTVKVGIAESDIGKIREGQSVTLRTLGDARTPYEAKVGTVQPVGEKDKVSGAVTYGALIEVDNSRRRLLVGMSVQVDIHTARVSKALSIPVTAIGGQEPDGRYWVHAQTPPTTATTATGPGHAREKRIVETGISDGQFVEVTQGLAEGESIQTVGAGPSSTEPKR